MVRGSGGGPDKTILNSTRFLRDRYPMLCAFMRDPEDREFARLEELAERWVAPLVAVDDRGPLDRRVAWRLGKICSERRPAIWHGHDYKSNWLGLRLRRAQPMRLVTTVHGWTVKGGWRGALYYRLDRLFIPRYQEVICVSRDLWERCRRLGVPEERCWLLPNAVDTEEYRRREPVEEVRARLGVAPGRLVIGAVGRLSPEKRLDLLLRAAAALGREDWEIWIAGAGPQLGPLRDLAARLGLGERVRLLGHRNDTVDLYQAMDLFVLASEREGLPNSLLEAMALELPVVATRVAGVPDLVRDGESGVLIEPGSAEALAAALETLLEDEELRRRYGAAARRKVERSHGFARRMERMGEIYDAALSR